MISSVEVNLFDKRWYSIIRKPKNFVLYIITFSLIELKIDCYKPNISIILAGDNLLRILNLKFRKINKPTNVLSFRYEKLYNRCDLGDIAVSIDTIQKESQKCNISVVSHVAHMLIHGLLHLLNYDHQKKNEETIMKQLERKILISLGYNILV